MKSKPFAVFITDIHLNKDNSNLVTFIFQQAIDLCLKIGVTELYCGGDVFTNRSGQPLETLDAFKTICKNLSDAGIFLHSIPGNHDKTDADDSRSYLDLYRGKNIKIYKNSSYFETNGVQMFFIPYFKDEKWIKQFNSVKRFIDKNKVNFLITHIGFDGVKNNDGSEVESSIKPSDLKMFNKVLVGHYHNASKLSNNVFYTGSVYQKDFGETITDKGFTILYDNGDIEHIPSVFPKYIREDVQLTDKESIRNLIEKHEGDEINHIRFVFHGKKSDFNSLDRSQFQKLGIDIKFEEGEETTTLSEEGVVINHDKKSIHKSFIEFCSSQQIKGDKLKYGLNLIKGIEDVATN